MVLKSETCLVVTEVEGWHPEIVGSAAASVSDSMLKCFQLRFFSASLFEQ